jgi:tRNA (guanine37-N1)-methyltransferase
MDALAHIKKFSTKAKIILLTPQGKVFTQEMAHSLSMEKAIILISGHYEGVDERIRKVADEQISIGDYVLTGGELPALVIIDSIARLIPGVLGDERSAEEESFACGILEYPHYTRPPDFRGLKVPEVLLSGNHKAISQWRRKEALRLTIVRRPDLMSRCVSGLKDEDYKLVSEIKEEEKKHEYD